MMFKKININFTKTELGDGAILLYCDEKATSYVLNETMAYIYENCEGMSFDDILHTFCNEFDVSDIDICEIKRDITQAINEMSDKGIIINV